jgi:hypothetical protein
MGMAFLPVKYVGLAWMRAGGLMADRPVVHDPSTNDDPDRPFGHVAPHVRNGSSPDHPKVHLASQLSKVEQTKFIES